MEKAKAREGVGWKREATFYRRCGDLQEDHVKYLEWSQAEK
jgi:hypothetical protein